MSEIDQVIEKLESIQNFIAAMPMEVSDSDILSAIIRELETHPNKSFCKRVLAELD